MLALLVCVAPAGLIAQGNGSTPGTAPTAGQNAPATPAEAEAKTPTLSLTANLVNLPVIVRDKKGALVQNLTKADFTLSVDGHPQVIRYFDRDQDLPLTLGLLVDTSQSQRSVLDEERDASSSFLDGMLTAPAGASPNRAPDRAFLIQFAREVELLQDLTSSRPKLQAAIKEIGTPNPNERSSSEESGSRDSDGNASGYHHGGTALYDAVYLSANDLLAKQQGRKAVIILSDGVDRNSKETLNRSIEAAQRADLIIYAIYFKGQDQHNSSNNNNNGGNSGGFPHFPGGGGGYPGGGGGGYPGGGGGGYPGGGGGRRGGQQPEENRVDGKKILQQMADETGGRMFEVKGREKVSDIYSQIAEELRSQYRLAYTPDSTIGGEGYHRIDLILPAQKNLKIQTRDGYYTGK